MKKNNWKLLLSLTVFLLLTAGMTVCVQAYDKEAYINPNTWYTDNLSDYNDTYAYHFRLPSPGKVSVSFQHNGAPGYEEYWSVHLRSFSNDIETYMSDLTIRGDETSCTSGYVGLPAGHYTITVGDEREFSSSDYRIKVNYTAASNWEQEPNENSSEPTIITLNKEYYGTLSYYNDWDYYKFRLTAPTRVRLSFRHGAMNDYEYHWQLQLMGEFGGTSYASLDSKGSETQLYSSYVTLPAGYYSIKVNRFGTYSNRPYAFRVMTASSSKISITKCKVASVPVQVYTGKNICPAPALRYGSKTLVRNKDYTISYKNNRLTGKASIIFTGKGSYTGKGVKYFYIRPAAVTQVKARISAGGKLQVSWKAAASGTGYYLLVGTNQKFTGNTSGYYISGRSKTAKIVTGLTKGKKYYFKVRSYQISGNTRINGLYSPTYSFIAK